jgi:hypothetical protein
MNNDEYNSETISIEYLTVSIEPDIHLSDNEQIHLDKCLSHLGGICHLPLVLNCTLLSVSSISNSINLNRESMRMNHSLPLRQPQKFYWMRNIKETYPNLPLPRNIAVQSSFSFS